MLFRSTAASARHWFTARSLEGLEPERASARLCAACATPMHRGQPGASPCRFARDSRGGPFSRAAGPHSPCVDRTACSQRARSNREPGDDEAVRRSSNFCHLAWSDHRVEEHEPPTLFSESARRNRLLLSLFLYDLLAAIHAAIANVDPLRSCQQVLDLVLWLMTERTPQG